MSRRLPRTLVRAMRRSASLLACALLYVVISSGPSYAELLIRVDPPPVCRLPDYAAQEINAAFEKAWRQIKIKDEYIAMLNDELNKLNSISWWGLDPSQPIAGAIAVNMQIAKTTADLIFDIADYLDPTGSSLALNAVRQVAYKIIDGVDPKAAIAEVAAAIATDEIIRKINPHAGHINDIVMIIKNNAANMQKAIEIEKDWSDLSATMKEQRSKLQTQLAKQKELLASMLQGINQKKEELKSVIREYCIGFGEEPEIAESEDGPPQLEQPPDDLPALKRERLSGGAGQGPKSLQQRLRTGKAAVREADLNVRRALQQATEASRRGALNLQQTQQDATSPDLSGLRAKACNQALAGHDSWLRATEGQATLSQQQAMRASHKRLQAQCR